MLEVDLSNNTLVGTIPEAFRQFAQTNVSMDLYLNYLSCCGKVMRRWWAKVANGGLGQGKARLHRMP